MARIELSKYLPDNIVKIIQNKLLPTKVRYFSFLYEIPNIYNYSTCFICNSLKSTIYQ